MLALPALRGGLLALLAATLFGISTPLLQRAGEGVGALTTAALLYAGAALVGALSRRPAHCEARMVRAGLPRLLAMAAFGAVIGPVALAWGLQRTSGTSASLLLTLEALFTAVLAWRLYHETMDRCVWAAMALLLAGAVVLVLDQQRGGGNRPFCHRRDRLRPQPALLPAGAARLRCGAHRLGLCLCTLHRRGAGACAGRPFGQRLDGAGQRTDAGGCRASLGRVTRPQTRARSVGARTRAWARRWASRPPAPANARG